MFVIFIYSFCRKKKKNLIFGSFTRPVDECRPNCVVRYVRRGKTCTENGKHLGPVTKGTVETGTYRGKSFYTRVSRPPHALSSGRVGHVWIAIIIGVRTTFAAHTTEWGTRKTIGRSSKTIRLDEYCKCNGLGNGQKSTGQHCRRPYILMHGDKIESTVYTIIYTCITRVYIYTLMYTSA